MDTTNQNTDQNTDGPVNDEITYIWQCATHRNSAVGVGTIQQMAQWYESTTDMGCFPAHVLVATSDGYQPVTVHIDHRPINVARESADADPAATVVEFICTWPGSNGEAITYLRDAIANDDDADSPDTSNRSTEQVVLYPHRALVALATTKRDLTAGRRDWIVNAIPDTLQMAGDLIARHGLDYNGASSSNPIGIRLALTASAETMAWVYTYSPTQALELWEHTARALVHYLYPQWDPESAFTDVSNALDTWNTNPFTTGTLVRTALYDAADWYTSMPDLTDLTADH